MNIISCALLFYGLSLSYSKSTVNSDVGLDTVGIIENHGYKSETHEVVTKDGYIITIHRIPQKTASKPPVLLFPGFACSSADYVALGATSLGLLLAENGSDVWLGNYRGNTWGLKHSNATIQTNPALFFNFSQHEIGVFDLPAIIDYILQETGFPKLIYCGHSQGGQVFFIMNSVDPGHNQKVEMAFGLSPASSYKHTRSIVVTLAKFFYSEILLLVKLLKMYDFAQFSNSTSRRNQKLCNTKLQITNMCLWNEKIFGGFDTLIKPDFPPVYVSNFPAGVSSKNLIHLLQMAKSETFSYYDYGSRNTRVYGQKRPPLYNVSKTEVPVYLYYSLNDLLVDYKDVQELERELPNVVTMKQISWKKFNHLEYYWSYKAADYVYSDILDVINTN